MLFLKVSCTRKKIIGGLGIALCLILAFINYSPSMQALRSLPDTVNDGGELYATLDKYRSSLFTVREDSAVDASLDETLADVGAQSATVRFLDRLPVKTISIVPDDATVVMPGGCTVGITIRTDGLLIVGLGSFISAGARVCPAEAAGLRAGDRIIYVDGESAGDTDTLAEHILSGGVVELLIERDGAEKLIAAAPLNDDDTGRYSLGMWVRESTLGIGTLTFYDMDSGRFGALGHSVTDVDTGAVLTVQNGSLLNANILGVCAGSAGVPGELKGTFSSASAKLGSIDANTDFGVFGDISDAWVNPLYPDGVTTARHSEITTGPALLLTTVDGSGVKAFECEVIKLFDQTAPKQKGMVIEVTDAELLSLTGGIVQGMSGSPIIQNGRLIGAVTHVLLSDPTRGYGIYIDNMTSAANDAA